MENKVNGYLELNGSIFRISSIDDIKHFLSRLGKEMEEMTQTDFELLCNTDTTKWNGSFADDCSVRYSSDGKLLLKSNKPELEEYKIKNSAICLVNQSFISKGNIEIRLLFMPNSVIAIGDFCFLNCGKLRTIIISDNLQFIGSGAFKGCGSLTKIDFHENLKYIESDAFNGCSSLTSIVLPSHLRILGSHAFKGCKSLKSVCFNSQDIEIGSGVFEGCNSLERIIIPKGFRNKYEALLPFDKEKLIESE